MNSTESNLHEMISKAAQFKRIENSEAYVFSDIREEILDDNQYFDRYTINEAY